MVDEPGTYYNCGCLRGGDPSDHPECCPTHGGAWKSKTYPVLTGEPRHTNDYDVTKQGESK